MPINRIENECERDTREGSVRWQVEEMCSVIDQIRSCVNMLEQEVSVILNPSLPVDPAPAPAVMKTALQRSSLADKLLSMSGELNCIFVELQNIRNRVDLA